MKRYREELVDFLEGQKEKRSETSATKKSTYKDDVIREMKANLEAAERGGPV